MRITQHSHFCWNCRNKFFTNKPKSAIRYRVEGCNVPVILCPTCAKLRNPQTGELKPGRRVCRHCHTVFTATHNAFLCPFCSDLVDSTLEFRCSTEGIALSPDVETRKIEHDYCGTYFRAYSPMARAWNGGAR